MKSTKCTVKGMNFRKFLLLTPKNSQKGQEIKLKMHCKGMFFINFSLHCKGRFQNGIFCPHIPSIHKPAAPPRGALASISKKIPNDYVFCRVFGYKFDF